MSEPGQPSTSVDPWGWTPEEREAVLQDARTGQAPSKIGSPAAGKTWSQIRKLCGQDSEFADAYRAARVCFLDSLERVTESAAVHGYTEETVTEDPEGQVTVTTYRKVDNRLRMSILAAQRPQTWGKRETVEHKLDPNTPDGSFEVRLAHRQAEPSKDAHPAEGEEGAA